MSPVDTQRIDQTQGRQPARPASGVQRTAPLPDQRGRQVSDLDQRAALLAFEVAISFEDAKFYLSFSDEVNNSQGKSAQDVLRSRPQADQDRLARIEQTKAANQKWLIRTESHLFHGTIDLITKGVTSLNGGEFRLDPDRALASRAAPLLQKVNAALEKNFEAALALAAKIMPKMDELLELTRGALGGKKLCFARGRDLYGNRALVAALEDFIILNDLTPSQKQDARGRLSEIKASLSSAQRAELARMVEELTGEILFVLLVARQEALKNCPENQELRKLLGESSHYKQLFEATVKAYSYLTGIFEIKNGLASRFGGVEGSDPKFAETANRVDELIKAKKFPEALALLRQLRAMPGANTELIDKNIAQLEAEIKLNDMSKKVMALLKEEKYEEALAILRQMRSIPGVNITLIDQEITRTGARIRLKDVFRRVKMLADHDRIDEARQLVRANRRDFDLLAPDALRETVSNLDDSEKLSDLIRLIMRHVEDGNTAEAQKVISGNAAFLRKMKVDTSKVLDAVKVLRQGEALKRTGKTADLVAAAELYIKNDELIKNGCAQCAGRKVVDIIGILIAGENHAEARGIVNRHGAFFRKKNINTQRMLSAADTVAEAQDNFRVPRLSASLDAIQAMINSRAGLERGWRDAYSDVMSKLARLAYWADSPIMAQFVQRNTAFFRHCSIHSGLVIPALRVIREADNLVESGRFAQAADRLIKEQELLKKAGFEPAGEVLGKIIGLINAGRYTEIAALLKIPAVASLLEGGTGSQIRKAAVALKGFSLLVEQGKTDEATAFLEKVDNRSALAAIGFDVDRTLTTLRRVLLTVHVGQEEVQLPHQVREPQAELTKAPQNSALIARLQRLLMGITNSAGRPYLPGISGVKTGEMDRYTALALLNYFIDKNPSSFGLNARTARDLRESLSRDTRGSGMAVTVDQELIDRMEADYRRQKTEKHFWQLLRESRLGKSIIEKRSSIQNAQLARAVLFLLGSSDPNVAAARKFIFEQGEATPQQLNAFLDLCRTNKSAQEIGRALSQTRGQSSSARTDWPQISVNPHTNEVLCLGDDPPDALRSTVNIFGRFSDAVVYAPEAAFKTVYAQSGGALSSSAAAPYFTSQDLRLMADTFSDSVEPSVDPVAVNVGEWRGFLQARLNSSGAPAGDLRVAIEKFSGTRRLDADKVQTLRRYFNRIPREALLNLPGELKRKTEALRTKLFGPVPQAGLALNFEETSLLLSVLTMDSAVRKSQFDALGDKEAIWKELIKQGYIDDSGNLTHKFTLNAAVFTFGVSGVNKNAVFNILKAAKNERTPDELRELKAIFEPGGVLTEAERKAAGDHTGQLGKKILETLRARRFGGAELSNLLAPYVRNGNLTGVPAGVLYLFIVGRGGLEKFIEELNKGGFDAGLIREVREYFILYSCVDAAKSLNPGGISRSESDAIKQLAAQLDSGNLTLADLDRLAREGNAGAAALARKIRGVRGQAFEQSRRPYEVFPLAETEGAPRPQSYQMTRLKYLYLSERAPQVLARKDQVQKELDSNKAAYEKLMGQIKKAKEEGRSADAASLTDQLIKVVEKHAVLVREFNAINAMIFSDAVPPDFYNWFVDKYVPSGGVLQRFGNRVFQLSYTETIGGARVRMTMQDACRLLLEAKEQLRRALPTWSSAGFSTLESGSEGGQSLSRGFNVEVNIGGIVYRVSSAAEYINLVKNAASFFISTVSSLDGFKGEGKVNVNGLVALEMAKGLNPFGGGAGALYNQPAVQVKMLIMGLYEKYLYREGLFSSAEVSAFLRSINDPDLDKLTKTDLKILREYLKELPDPGLSAELNAILDRLDDSNHWNGSELKKSREISGLLLQLVRALSKSGSVLEGDTNAANIKFPWAQGADDFVRYFFPGAKREFWEIAIENARNNKGNYDVLNILGELVTQYGAQRITLELMMPIMIYGGLTASAIHDAILACKGEITVGQLFWSQERGVGRLPLAFFMFRNFAPLWYRQVNKDILDGNLASALAGFWVTNFITMRGGWSSVWANTAGLVDGRMLARLGAPIPSEFHDGLFHHLSESSGFSGSRGAEAVRWALDPIGSLNDRINTSITDDSNRFLRGVKWTSNSVDWVMSKPYELVDLAGRYLFRRGRTAYSLREVRESGVERYFAEGGLASGSGAQTGQTFTDAQIAMFDAKKTRIDHNTARGALIRRAIDRAGLPSEVKGKIEVVELADRYLPRGCDAVYKFEGSGADRTYRVYVRSSLINGKLTVVQEIVKRVLEVFGKEKPWLRKIEAAREGRLQRAVLHEAVEIRGVSQGLEVDAAHRAAVAEVDAAHRVPEGRLKAAAPGDPKDTRIAQIRDRSSTLEAVGEGEFWRGFKETMSDRSASLEEKLAWMREAHRRKSGDRLYDTQLDALIQYSEGKNILLGIGTGQGKSYTTLLGAGYDVCQNNRPSYVLTTDTKLVAQLGRDAAVATLRAAGIKVFVIDGRQSPAEVQRIYEAVKTGGILIMTYQEHARHISSSEIPRESIRKGCLWYEEADYALVERGNTSFRMAMSGDIDPNTIVNGLRLGEHRRAWTQTRALFDVFVREANKYFDSNGRLTEAANSMIENRLAKLGGDNLLARQRIEALRTAAFIIEAYKVVGTGGDNPQLADIRRNFPLNSKALTTRGQTQILDSANELQPRTLFGGEVDNALRVLLGRRPNAPGTTFADINHAGMLAFHEVGKENGGNLKGSSGSLPEYAEALKKLYGCGIEVSTIDPFIKEITLTDKVLETAQGRSKFESQLRRAIASAPEGSLVKVKIVDETSSEKSTERNAFLQRLDSLPGVQNAGANAVRLIVKGPARIFLSGDAEFKHAAGKAIETKSRGGLHLLTTNNGSDASKMYELVLDTLPAEGSKRNKGDKHPEVILLDENDDRKSLEDKIARVIKLIEQRKGVILVSDRTYRGLDLKIRDGLIRAIEVGGRSLSVLCEQNIAVDYVGGPTTLANLVQSLGRVARAFQGGDKGFSLSLNAVDSVFKKFLDQAVRDLNRGKKPCGFADGTEVLTRLNELAKEGSLEMKDPQLIRIFKECYKLAMSEHVESISRHLEDSKIIAEAQKGLSELGRLAQGKSPQKLVRGVAEAACDAALRTAELTHGKNFTSIQLTEVIKRVTGGVETTIDQKVFDGDKTARRKLIIEALEREILRQGGLRRLMTNPGTRGLIAMTCVEGLRDQNAQNDRSKGSSEIEDFLKTQKLDTSEDKQKAIEGLEREFGIKLSQIELASLLEVPLVEGRTRGEVVFERFLTKSALTQISRTLEALFRDVLLPTELSRNLRAAVSPPRIEVRGDAFVNTAEAVVVEGGGQQGRLTKAQLGALVNAQGLNDAAARMLQRRNILLETANGLIHPETAAKLKGLKVVDDRVFEENGIRRDAVFLKGPDGRYTLCVRRSAAVFDGSGNLTPESVRRLGEVLTHELIEIDVRERGLDANPHEVGLLAERSLVDHNGREAGLAEVRFVRGSDGKVYRLMGQDASGKPRLETVTEAEAKAFEGIRFTDARGGALTVIDGREVRVKWYRGNEGGLFVRNSADGELYKLDQRGNGWEHISKTRAERALDTARATGVSTAIFAVLGTGIDMAIQHYRGEEVSWGQAGNTAIMNAVGLNEFLLKTRLAQAVGISGHLAGKFTFFYDSMRHWEDRRSTSIGIGNIAGFELGSAFGTMLGRGNKYLSEGLSVGLGLSFAKAGEWLAEAGFDNRMTSWLFDNSFVDAVQGTARILTMLDKPVDAVAGFIDAHTGISRVLPSLELTLPWADKAGNYSSIDLLHAAGGIAKAGLVAAEFRAVSHVGGAALTRAAAFTLARAGGRQGVLGLENAAANAAARVASRGAVKVAARTTGRILGNTVAAAGMAAELGWAMGRRPGETGGQAAGNLAIAMGGGGLITAAAAGGTALFSGAGIAAAGNMALAGGPIGIVAAGLAFNGALAYGIADQQIQMYDTMQRTNDLDREQNRSQGIKLAERGWVAQNANRIGYSRQDINEMFPLVSSAERERIYRTQRVGVANTMGQFEHTTEGVQKIGGSDFEVIERAFKQGNWRGHKSELQFLDERIPNWRFLVSQRSGQRGFFADEMPSVFSSRTVQDYIIRLEHRVMLSSDLTLFSASDRAKIMATMVSGGFAKKVGGFVTVDHSRWVRGKALNKGELDRLLNMLANRGLRIGEAKKQQCLFNAINRALGRVIIPRNLVEEYQNNPEYQGINPEDFWRETQKSPTLSEGELISMQQKAEQEARKLDGFMKRFVPEKLEKWRQLAGLARLSPVQEQERNAIISQARTRAVKLEVLTDGTSGTREILYKLGVPANVPLSMLRNYSVLWSQVKNILNTDGILRKICFNHKLGGISDLEKLPADQFVQIVAEAMEKLLISRGFGVADKELDILTVYKMRQLLSIRNSGAGAVAPQTKSAGTAAQSAPAVQARGANLIDGVPADITLGRMKGQNKPVLIMNIRDYKAMFQEIVQILRKHRLWGKAMQDCGVGAQSISNISDKKLSEVLVLAIGRLFKLFGEDSKIPSGFRWFGRNENYKISQFGKNMAGWLLYFSSKRTPAPPPTVAQRVVRAAKPAVRAAKPVVRAVVNHHPAVVVGRAVAAGASRVAPSVRSWAARTRIGRWLGIR